MDSGLNKGDVHFSLSVSVRVHSPRLFAVAALRAGTQMHLTCCSSTSLRMFSVVKNTDHHIFLVKAKVNGMGTDLEGRVMLFLIKQWRGTFSGKKMTPGYKSGLSFRGFS